MHDPRRHDDLPYAELYDAWSVTFALDSGERILLRDREHPLELAVFKGSLTHFQSEENGDLHVVDTPIQTKITVYSAWDSQVGEFDEPLREVWGKAALASGRFFDAKKFSVEVAIRDADDSLADRWLSELAQDNALTNGKALVCLVGRRDLPNDESTSFIEEHAWTSVGLHADDFVRSLDCQENGPPVAHFESAV